MRLGVPPLKAAAGLGVPPLEALKHCAYITQVVARLLSHENN